MTSLGIGTMVLSIIINKATSGQPPESSVTLYQSII